jgi:hypothetical protein
VTDSEVPPNPRWEQLLAEFDNRRDEAYAAAVVEHVLGARVKRRDLPGAPRGTVDAEVFYPDNRTAVLEITSVEESATWHLRAKLDRMKPTPAPGQLMWIIRPSSVAELDRLLTIYERIIAVCEQHGALNPEVLPFGVIAADADLRWLAWEDARGSMSGHPSSGDPKVFWEWPIVSAVWGNDADEIAAGVSAALQVEPSLGHVAKLLRNPNPERHLFLVVGSTGLSNAAAFSLIEPDDVPTTDPDVPDGLDNLWLGPGWGSTVTVWSRGRGWRNEQARDEPPTPRKRRKA